MKQFIGNFFGLILIIVLSFWALKPLFAPGFFPMHDNTQVARVFEMGKALQDGMLPVRWTKDLGYGFGYPIFNFYAPLAYYIGGFFTLLGFDALISTKLMMALGIVLSGIFMYLFARQLWGELGGVISGLLYVYAPYHAVDIYVRGDVAEFWAYAFVPLAFWAIYKLSITIEQNSKLKTQKNQWGWIIIGGLGYAGVILSHNLTAMMVTPFLLVFSLLLIFLSDQKIHTLYCILYTLILGVLLSAFYWLPALLEISYTNVMSQIGGGADFRDHFVCLSQLWNSQWGFGGSAPGCMDGLSFQIGKLHAILSAIAFLFAVFSLFRKQKQRTALVLTAILGLIGSILLTLELSKPFWEAIPLMAYFQYPWRFLLMTSFFSSLAAGMLIWFFADISWFGKRNFEIQLAISVVILVGLLGLNIKLFTPQTMFAASDKDYTSQQTLRFETSKISDEYMPKDFFRPSSFNEVPKEAVETQPVTSQAILTDKTHLIERTVNIPSGNTIVHFNLAHFPTWNFYLDDNPISSIKTNKGYNIVVGKGEYFVSAFFDETPIETLSEIVSLAGVLIVVTGIIYGRVTRYA